MYPADLPTPSEKASDFHVNLLVATISILTLKAKKRAQCSILKEFTLTSDTPIEEATVVLASVEGKAIKPLCRAQVTLDTPTVAIRLSFYVVGNDVPLNVDELLGMEFIKKYKADILGRDLLKLYGYCMPLINGATTIKLPPGTENLLHAKTSTNFVGLVRKIEIANDVILGSCVTPPKGNRCVVSIVNTTASEGRVQRPTSTLEPLTLTELSGKGDTEALWISTIGTASEPSRLE